MRTTVHNIQQGSNDWKRLRLGKFTASEVGKLLQKGKSAPFSQTAINYIMQVAAERTIDTSFFSTEEEWEQLFFELNGPTSYVMRRGSELEDTARQYYQQKKGVEVEQVGFIQLSKYLGDSPDGIVRGGYKKAYKAIEIKCPSLKVHYEHCKLKTADDLKRFNPIYYAQCQMHCLATKTTRCDWISFDYRAKKKLHILTIPRDNEYLKELLSRVELAEQYIKEN